MSKFAAAQTYFRIILSRCVCNAYLRDFLTVPEQSEAFRKNNSLSLQQTVVYKPEQPTLQRTSKQS
jgi:hypothetical protein